jgi:hypothetical protein
MLRLERDRLSVKLERRPRARKREKRSRLRLLFLLFAIAAIATGAEAPRKPKPEGQSEVLAGRVNSLIRQLYGLHLDQFEPATSQIQKLVVRHFDEWIVNREPNFVEVREQLESMFSKVRYPFTAEPTVFEAPWKSSRLIFAGYTVGWSDVDRISTVVFYESRNGRTRRVAITKFLPRNDLHYDPVPPDAAGNFRIIIWGNRLGLDHPRLSAVLYSFDGQELKSLWKEEDAYDGHLQVRGDEVVLKYLKQKEYIRALQQKSLPPRYEATYKLTADGLKLEKVQDIPF